MKNVLKFLISLCLILTLSASAKEVRLIHITDIGLNSKNAYKLQETIKEINSFKDIDFVLSPGLKTLSHACLKPHTQIPLK